MTTTLDRAHLDLVWQLYADVSGKVQRRPVYTHLLDHALLSLELRRALGDDCGAADPRESFVHALEVLPTEPEAGPWLYRGAAQAGWLAIQLARGTGGGPPRTVSNLAAIDDLLLDVLLDYPDSCDVDLPRGVLGLGVYALDHPDDGVRDKLLGAVLDVLDRRVERDADGLFIRLSSIPERQRDGSAGCRIVGVAHGTAGLVSFLSSVVLAGDDGATRARPMLDDALRWLLAQPVDVGHGVFPHRVELPGSSARPTWCSGDPGAGLALEVARAATGSAAAAALAERVARVVVARPADECGVCDATICHGAAGLVWYGHRMHEAGVPGAAVMARSWAAWVAERRREDRLRYVSPWGMIRDVSFLEGDAGVALALLHATVGGSPSWQELLLAVPVGRA
jgi:hypothetical protein